MVRPPRRRAAPPARPGRESGGGQGALRRLRAAAAPGLAARAGWWWCSARAAGQLSSSGFSATSAAEPGRRPRPPVSTALGTERNGAARPGRRPAGLREAALPSRGWPSGQGQESEGAGPGGWAPRLRGGAAEESGEGRGPCRPGGGGRLADWLWKFPGPLRRGLARLGAFGGGGLGGGGGSDWGGKQDFCCSWGGGDCEEEKVLRAPPSPAKAVKLDFACCLRWSLARWRRRGPGGEALARLASRSALPGPHPVPDPLVWGGLSAGRLSVARRRWAVVGRTGEAPRNGDAAVLP